MPLHNLTKLFLKCVYFKEEKVKCGEKEERRLGGRKEEKASETVT